jgi:DNA-binding IclR family transcriptional regulator
MAVKGRPRLTATERRALDALRFLAVQGGWVRAAEVASRTGQSPEGAAQTLTALVRKRLVRRDTGRGHVWFSLTGAGWALATPRTRQAACTCTPQGKAGCRAHDPLLGAPL